MKNWLNSVPLLGCQRLDEGIPFLLFAFRESFQESSDFSPAELVFGHTVRGPWKLLHQQLTGVASPSQNVLNHVSSLREHFGHAYEVAKAALSGFQSKMKLILIRLLLNAVINLETLCSFFFLFPVQCFKLSSQALVIEQKLNKTDYIIRIPDRRRKTPCEHVQVLRCQVQWNSSLPSSWGVSCNFNSCAAMLFSSGWWSCDARCSCSVENSLVLGDLENYLIFLGQIRVIFSSLLNATFMLFSNALTQTTML